ncbi:MAG: hypothetical protein JOZ07_18460 [Solirubrobacterales bacterium]|nr:hypothetical protein [Solirubrobacterales bacterium]
MSRLPTRSPQVASLGRRAAADAVNSALALGMAGVAATAFVAWRSREQQRAAMAAGRPHADPGPEPVVAATAVPAAASLTADVPTTPSPGAAAPSRGDAVGDGIAAAGAAPEPEAAGGRRLTPARGFRFGLQALGLVAAVAARNWRGPGQRLLGIRRIDARTQGPVTVRSALTSRLVTMAWEAGAARVPVPGQRGAAPTLLGALVRTTLGPVALALSALTSARAQSLPDRLGGIVVVRG